MTFNIFKRAPRLLAPVARLYGQRLDQCGATAKGVFWRGEHWQVRRFERLCEIISREDAADGGIVINDLGCGYGAMFDYLHPLSMMNGSRYIGYDITQEMIAACRDRITDPRAKFLRKMIATERADYSFACGTYNMHGGADEAAWRNYVEDNLKQLWSMTDKALAFNMLRKDEEEKFQGLYYIEPADMLAFCRRVLSADVEMFDERPLPDVTYFIRR